MLKRVQHDKIKFFKDSFNFFSFLFLIFGAIACAVPPQDSLERQQNSAEPALRGSFMLSVQKAPPHDIQSVHLAPKGNPALPPVIKLHSPQKLVLSFDYLSEQNRQFRVEVSHRSRDWQKSPIGPSVYLDSFFQTYIQGSEESFSQQPAYQHLEYEFPNPQLRPIVSGNYLLEVYSYSGDELLFSVPFFITEDRGALQTRVETIFAQRKDAHSLDQLFSTYRYPPFIEFPQFDLGIAYTQNQFWGRMREAGFLNTFGRGEISGHIDRNEAFISDYEIKVLDLRSFVADGQQVLEYRPGTTPPTVILRRDVQNLDTNPRYFSASGLGIPIDDRSSGYARVQFSLDTDAAVPHSANIYIVGDFNNWMINDLNKMSYDIQQNLWQGHALIKQGEYAYKYVLVENGVMDDLALDQGFLAPRQEYLTFVYFKDPTHNFDRLLKVGRVVSR
ncbi:MAG TPA: type IX secretion system plug protein domain-containing protein [Balneolaceae bacterium]|nr:type IX secretion system plug protein domain-containing protein [Balneolaceae bacterium]